MRTYVKIAKEGEDDDIAEVPTNSEGLLPEATVTALFGGTSAIKYKVILFTGCPSLYLTVFETELHSMLFIKELS